jgi:hypothetical protein
MRDKSIVHYNYYIYNTDKGLYKVEISNDIKTLVDLLTLYDVEQEFLDKISSDLRIKDIKNILIEHDFWKSTL